MPVHTVNNNTQAANGKESTFYADCVTLFAHKISTAMFQLYPQGIASSICLVKAPLFLLALLL